MDANRNIDPTCHITMWKTPKLELACRKRIKRAIADLGESMPIFALDIYQQRPNPDVTIGELFSKLGKAFWTENETEVELALRALRKYCGEARVYAKTFIGKEEH